MTLPELTALVMIVALAAYAVLGGADFGVGVWDLTAGRGERAAAIRRHIADSMGPVWEANHVWLIFVLVIAWTAFPEGFAALASTLYIPLFAAAIGIILRGAAFAFRDHLWAEGRTIALLFALSSIITPFFLGAAVGGVASGRVPLGNAAGDPLTSWWNPTSVLIGLLSVATGAFLAAVFLCGDARGREMADAFRRRAIDAGAAAGGLALGGLLVLRADAELLYAGLTSGAGLAFVALSAAGGLATLALVWGRRFGLARLTAAVAVGAIILGWGYAQMPDFLIGELSLADAAAPRATLVALLGSVAVGLVVLVPSMGYLFWLQLTGRLRQEQPSDAER